MRMLYQDCVQVGADGDNLCNGTAHSTPSPTLIDTYRQFLKQHLSARLPSSKLS